jgi:hypothetical protein
MYLPTMSILTENVTTGLTSPLNESPVGDTKQRGFKVTVSPWALMAVTCILLGISGGIRFWRDLKFKTLAQENTACPFPLKELPRSIAGWHAVEGSDKMLDPEIARIAGSSDHFIRIYQNEKTNEQVTVFVLYGLANSVYGHTPEVCYPAAGYQQTVASDNRDFSIPDSTIRAQYCSATFAKTMGGIGPYEEVDVSYTFLHDGEWLPELKSRWKSFRYHPAIFKIQLQRPSSRVTIHESPTESLLSGLVQEIDRRVFESKTRVATVATPKP